MLKWKVKLRGSRISSLLGNDSDVTSMSSLCSDDTKSLDELKNVPNFNRKTMNERYLHSDRHLTLPHLIDDSEDSLKKRNKAAIESFRKHYSHDAPERKFLRNVSHANNEITVDVHSKHSNSPVSFRPRLEGKPSSDSRKSIASGFSISVIEAAFDSLSTEDKSNVKNLYLESVMKDSDSEDQRFLKISGDETDDGIYSEACMEFGPESSGIYSEPSSYVSNDCLPDSDYRSNFKKYCEKKFSFKASENIYDVPKKAIHVTKHRIYENHNVCKEVESFEERTFFTKCSDKNELNTDHIMRRPHPLPRSVYDNPKVNEILPRENHPVNPSHLHKEKPQDSNVQNIIKSDEDSINQVESSKTNESKEILKVPDGEKKNIEQKDSSLTDKNCFQQFIRKFFKNHPQCLMKRRRTKKIGSNKRSSLFRRSYFRRYFPSRFKSMKMRNYTVNSVKKENAKNRKCKNKISKKKKNKPKKKKITARFYVEYGNFVNGRPFRCDTLHRTDFFREAHVKKEPPDDTSDLFPCSEKGPKSSKKKVCTLNNVEVKKPWIKTKTIYSEFSTEVNVNEKVGVSTFSLYSSSTFLKIVGGNITHECFLCSNFLFRDLKVFSMTKTLMKILIIIGLLFTNCLISIINGLLKFINMFHISLQIFRKNVYKTVISVYNDQSVQTLPNPNHRELPKLRQQTGTRKAKKKEHLRCSSSVKVS